MTRKRMPTDHSSTGHLSIAGMRVEYQYHCADADADGDSDRHDRPVLVLLHEGLGCVAMWKDFPQRLSAASGASVFAYSRSGYGGSSPCALPRPLDYMQREGEQVLPQVLEAIGARRYVLLGHSDGASIAAAYAGAQISEGLGSQGHSQLQGLILVAPHFFTEDDGLQAIAQAKLAFDQHGLRDQLKKYHGDNVDCAFRGWNDAWLHADFKRWNITSYLPRISVPVLAIQGQRDQYGSRAQLDAVSNDCAGPVEQLLLPDCAHSPFREQPQQTLDAICRWLLELRDSNHATRGQSTSKQQSNVQRGRHAQISPENSQ